MLVFSENPNAMTLTLFVPSAAIALEMFAKSLPREYDAEFEIPRIFADSAESNAKTSQISWKPLLVS